MVELKPCTFFVATLHLIALFRANLVLSQKIILNPMDPQLTLYKGSLTTSNHQKPIPQLKCTGDARKCELYEPGVIQCMQQAYVDMEYIWQCTSPLLNRDFRIEVVKVTCEHINGPMDPNVLEGSCGLEYTIEQKTPKLFGPYYRKELYDSNRLSNFLTLLVMLIIVLAVYKTCTKNRENPPRHDINGTFANIVHGGSDSNLQHYGNIIPGQNNGGVYFPPPPPSYGFATASHAGRYASNANKPDQDTTNTATAASTANPTDIQLAANTNLSVTNNPIPNLSSRPPSTNTWSGFLSGAAMQANLLLNRRNTNISDGPSAFVRPAANPSVAVPRRSESPPPAYDASETPVTVTLVHPTVTR